jgi:hypothetical protein
MTKKIYKKICKNCGEKFQPYKTTDKYCSYACFKADSEPIEFKPRQPINKRSVKGKLEDYQYGKRRKLFLSKPENQICFVNGCQNKANSIEHRNGRIGKNFLDESTWAPCCIFHNLEFERNPELSKKYQLSKFHEGRKIEK